MSDKKKLVVHIKPASVPFVRSEARRLGFTATGYINYMLLEEQKKKQEKQHGNN